MRATPNEIMHTIKASVRFGSFIRVSQEIRRIATAVNAYELKVSAVKHVWAEID